MNSRSAESIAPLRTTLSGVSGSLHDEHGLPDKFRTSVSGTNERSETANVTSLSSVEERRKLVEFLQSTASPDRALERLRSFLLSLLSDESEAIRITNDSVIVPKDALKLRTIVAHCPISSQGTASKWRTAWTKRHFIHANTIYLQPFRQPLTGHSKAQSPTPPGLDQRSRDSTSTLALLLTELRHAHQHSLDGLIDQITGWIEHELQHCETFHPPAKSERETATNDRETATPSPELVSSFIDNSTLTNFPSVAETSLFRGTRKSTKPRSTNDIAALLEPLTILIRQRHLTEMTNKSGVEGILRGFSDEEITIAVKAIARLVRRDNSITSPIGLLVHHAKEGTPDFFELSDSDVQPAATASPPPDPTCKESALANIAALRQSTTPSPAS